MGHKGIILAGGFGSRLYPATSVVSKQLLPVYDKPLIYYPLSTLMLADIRDILIITSKEQHRHFYDLFLDGSNLGLNIQYAHQDYPNGIAECFSIANNFIGSDNITLILGDNIFYGNDLTNKLLQAKSRNGCTLFVSSVPNPEKFGVLSYNDSKEPYRIIEKPLNPPSKHAVCGLYFYDNHVIEYSKYLEPSERNELEITDINNIYLTNKLAHIEYLSRGILWLDTGTPNSLLEASNTIKSIQHSTNTIIGCIEEIAINKKWIDKISLTHKIQTYNNSYSKYIESLI